MSKFEQIKQQLEQNPTEQKENIIDHLKQIAEDQFLSRGRKRVPEHFMDTRENNRGERVFNYLQEFILKRIAEI